jgi:hypothetical protein
MKAKMELKQRYWLIELLAWWEGRVCTSHLIKHMALGRGQAQADLTSYQKLYPLQLQLDASIKGFVPAPTFQCQLISGDVVEYLNWLSLSEQTYIKTATEQWPFYALTLPARPIDPKLIRALVQAMRKQLRVDVDYLSLSSPQAEGRVITPHHFVRTGLRWHVRGYDEKHRQYRDFVLSRFRGDAELMDKSVFGAAADPGWQTQVELQLTPDPRLSPAQQQVIADDYRLTDGILRLYSRACLAQYLLQEMQVSLKPEQHSPESQQLVLHNQAELAPWLFSRR